MKVNRHKKRISAVLLLGVFLFTLLHNVVPHIHHTHGDDKIHKDGANLGHAHADHHSHGHDHSHDHDSEEENTFDFLQFLGIHSHVFHVHDQISIASFKMEKERKTTIDAGPTTEIGFNTYEEPPLTKASSPHEERHYSSHYRGCIPLRGPPTLG